MAEVIRLEHDERPPANEQRVLVDQDPVWAIGMAQMVYGPPGLSVTVYVVRPFGAAERADAIEKAKARADGDGIARVYEAGK
jgi:hypothetical protein